MGSNNVRFWVQKNPTYTIYMYFLDFKKILLKKMHKKININ